MIRRALLTVLLCCSMLAVHAASPALPAPAVTSAASVPVVIGESRVLQSAVLDEQRRYSVALPPGYAWSPDRRYPVLLVLDAERHFAHATTTTRFLAANGEMPDTIVVGLDSTNRLRDFTQTDWPEAWVGGGGADRFARFLTTELLPAIERDYRTDGFRTVVGHSASGQFALHLLATRPDTFRAYLVNSPSLDWDDRLPRRELAEAFARTASLPAFVYVARSDDRGPALADAHALFATLEQGPRGLRAVGRDFPGETHAGIPLVALVDGLRTLYRGYRFDIDLPGASLADAERQYAQVSESLGWPTAVPEAVVQSLAYASMNAGRHDEAIALFARNVERHPRSAGAHAALADGYAEARRWREALASATRAAALAAEQGHPDRANFEAQVARHRAELATPRR